MNTTAHLTDGMNNLQISSSKEEMDVCACCGKEGSDLNICNKCKGVKYCNAACKKKHRTKHKKKCKRRVAELYDIELFKQPPLPEDCPICFLPLPLMSNGKRYYGCCGKIICSGCEYAPVKDNFGNKIKEQKCPFCRTPAWSSDEEYNEWLLKRVELNDTEAIYDLGICYRDGEYGFAQDYTKAFELFVRAGELGSANAYCNIGRAYYNGEGVGRDEKKAKHYYELAAMKGNVDARYTLGFVEGCAGNWERALKHYMIAAEGGYNDSIKCIQQMYMDGNATKEDYAKALRAYQLYLVEVRSKQRELAAAFSDEYKYY